MMVKVCEIIQPLIAPISNLTEEIACHNILLQVESKISQAKTLSLLTGQQYSNDEATVSRLKVFTDYLSDRWLRIVKTDAIYFHNPRTKSNRACLLLADAIARILKVSIYELIMPTVTAYGPILTRKQFDNYNLHELILSDENIPIEIEACLNAAAEKKTTSLYHTCKRASESMLQIRVSKEGENMDPLRLNDEEANRVINHSFITRKYYKLIGYIENLNNNKNVSTVFSPALATNLNEAIASFVLSTPQLLSVTKEAFTENLMQVKEQLHEALGEDEYELNVSYRDAGDKRLLSHILTGIKSLHDLAYLLREYFDDKSQWKEFMSYFDDDRLEKLVLHNDLLDAVIKNKAHYIQKNASHNKAVLFCLVEVYKRAREKEGEHTSTLGGFFGGHGKQEKLLAANVLQKFFESDAPLNGTSLEQYISKVAKERNKPQLHNIIFDYGIKTNSNLADIALQADRVNDPAFYKQEEKQASHWGLLNWK